MTERDEIVDGGHAFPQYSGKPVPGGGVYYDISGGMSLRDWFAGQFAVGMTASPELMEVVTSGSVLDGTVAERLAQRAYQYADAMLTARAFAAAPGGKDEQ